MKTDPVELIPIIEEDIKQFWSNGVITLDEMEEAMRRLRNEDKTSESNTD